jgi:hypothetical protein
MLQIELRHDASPCFGWLHFNREQLRPLIGEAMPSLITFTEHDMDERMRVEAFIRDTYAKTYQAEIIVNYPILMSVRDADGRLLAAMGIQDVLRGGFFLEQYLDEPLEIAIGRAADQTADRMKILEVGNLASQSSGAAKFLFLAFHAVAAARDYDWVAVTATAVLHRYFNSLGIETRKLANATPDRVNDTSSRWGTYYEMRPRVLVNTIHQGLKALLDHFKAEYTDVHGLRLALHDLPRRI